MQYLLAHSQNNPRNSEGAFVKLSDGRIFFAYSRYYGNDSYDDCPADISAIISADGGRTWSEPFTVVKNTKQNVMSVSLLRLQDDRIALHYLEKSAIPGYTQNECRPKIIFSSDECQSWSEPKDIAEDIPAIYFVGNNDRLIQLKSGRLLIPYSRHIYTASNLRGIGEGVGVFFYSDDGGNTWLQSKTTCYPPAPMYGGLMEPGVVELSDGSVYGWFRTSAGCQYKTRSYDGGVTWTAPVPEPSFRSPNSPLSIKRNPSDGMLYAVWNHQHPLFAVPLASTKWGARTPLIVARSRDEGESWDEHQIVENSPDHGYAYTAIHFEQDNMFLAYCCGGEPDCIRMLQDCKINIIPLSQWKCNEEQSDFTAMNDHGARR